LFCMINTDNILLFDGICNLCNRAVTFIIRIDKNKKIRFAPIQSIAAQSLLKQISVSPDVIDSVVYVAGGKVHLKSSAVLHIFKDIGRGWKIIYGFIIIPAFIRDYFYDLIAKSRYRIFGRRDNCMLPSDEIKRRFLES
jgi:predicted DCC family thiol-disulfide oxidoreductase YuxK